MRGKRDSYFILRGVIGLPHQALGIGGHGDKITQFRVSISCHLSIQYTPSNRIIYININIKHRNKIRGKNMFIIFAARDLNGCVAGVAGCEGGSQTYVLQQKISLSYQNVYYFERNIRGGEGEGRMREEGEEEGEEVEEIRVSIVNTCSHTTRISCNI